MTHPELFGKLREHEMDLLRMTKDEEKDRKTRSLALKSTMLENTSDESQQESEEEDMALIVRKFRKFMKKEHQRKPNFSSNKTKHSTGKKVESNTTYTCFECGKTGHFKADCPNLKKKKDDRKPIIKKKKRAYIAWEDNASTTSSSSSENEEEANICLMANDKEEMETSSDEVSSDSNSLYDKDDFEYLLNAFNEMHREAQKISIANKVLKNEVESYVEKCLSLEKMILSFQTENSNLKKEIEDMSSSNKLPCENCATTEKKLTVLENSLAKFSKGKSDLTDILENQRRTHERTGLGYTPIIKKKNNLKRKTNFKRSKTNSKLKHGSCHYCMKNGHKIYECYFKNIAVPNGKAKWIKKAAITVTNKGGPKPIVWVPKST